MSNNQQAVVPRAAVTKAVRTVLGPLLYASPFLLIQAAGAQEQGPAAPQATTETSLIQEVVVTGSMIARPAAETAEAITVIQADTLKNQGITNVEQALNTVTSNVPSLNIAQSVGTFSGGGTFANLRDLGNGRTLVLLDGQRLANNAFSGNAVDLSGIPFSSIQSVQVLREGASALYGSDAIAGVVNFITKKNFQGLEIQGNFDQPQESGGASHELDFTFGHGDLVNDGYNLMITGSYTKQNELQATKRAFSAVGFYPALGYTNTNNPGTWPGSIQDASGNYWQFGYPACTGNPYLTTALGNCAYRYSAATDLLPQSDEYSWLVSFTKALPGNNTLQLQYFYTTSEVVAWSGPVFYYFQMDPASPYFPKASQLSCSSCTEAAPDLADPIDAVWTDPNNNRYAGNINNEQRILLTFSGSNAGWDYSGTLNYSQNKNDNRNIAGYPNEAVLAPGGVLSDLINPFGPQSATGQALINSSYIDGVYEVGTDKRWSVDGHASHTLFHIFHATNPTTVALGVSVGGERFYNSTTPYNTLVSAATGLGDATIQGSRQTQAIYVELDAPLSEQLDVDLSDREDRYSDFGTTNNGKISVRYQPASFVTFRGTASTGFRAPTLANLYAPNSIAASAAGPMGEGNPDCVTPAATGLWTAATCDTQGLGLFGGNRNLTPEKSKNYDLGVVVSPIRDMGITLDWYRIVLTNTIGAVPAAAIYGDPEAFPNLIHANNAGTLTPSIQEAASCTPYTAPTCGYIILGAANTGGVTTSGVDLSIQYQQHTPIGTFHEDLEGTRITKYDLQQYTTGPFLNLVGWFNTEPPAYRWQHSLRLDWSSPQGSWGSGVNNRFYSSYIDEFSDGNGNQRTVGSYSVWDVYASYKPISNLTLLFGIRNVFDTRPPFSNAAEGNFAAGYNSLVSDPLLRNFYINVKYKIF
jgi:iron complex outermembrane receptor protein